MQLTERDQTIFRHLEKFGALTTKQIHELAFFLVSNNTFYRRLRVLEQEGFIRAVYGWTKRDQIWALGKSAVGYSKRKFNRATLEHDVGLNSIQIALTRSEFASEWTSDAELRSEAFKTFGRDHDEPIPDAIFTLFRKKIPRRVALEYEITPKSAKRYENILRHHAFDVRSEGILYVVHSDGIGKAVARKWGERFASGKPFMWVNFTDLVSSPSSCMLHIGDKVHKFGEFYELPSLFSPAPTACTRAAPAGSEFEGAHQPVPTIPNT